VLGIHDCFSIEGYRRVSDATFSLLSGLTCSWADAMESEGHDNRITALAIMNSDELRSPVQFLHPVLAARFLPEWLREYETWWQSEGQAISFLGFTR
jgi:hypothetical protein